jgi:hypothetical protein
MKAIPPREKIPFKTDPETGRITYEGSIGSMHFDLTVSQKSQVLKALKEKPRYASDIVVEGVSPYDPASLEAVRRYIGELIESGTVKLVKDAKNKNLGWQATDEAKKT